MADVRIWPSTNGPDAKAIEGEHVTLSFKARIDSAGVYLKKMHYYRPLDLTTGTRRAVVFQAGNATPLLNEPFVDSGFGWQTFDVAAFLGSAGLALTNGNNYFFATHYSADGGGYAATQFYFDTGPGASGFNLGDMVYVYHGGDITPEPGQGVYKVSGSATTPALPDSSYRDTNYWTDATFGTATTEVTKSQSTQWNVRAIVSDNQSTQWNLRSALGKSMALSWAVRQAPALSRSTGWNVNQSLGLNRDVFWSVYRSVGLSQLTRWNTLGVLTKSTSMVWEVDAGVGVSLDVAWNIFDISSVTKSLAVNWGVLASIAMSRDIDWEVREVVLVNRDIAWGVTSIIADSIRPEWNVRAELRDSQNFRWNVASNIVTPQTLLRLYLNGTWVQVPVKVWNGTTWVEVPVRSYKSSSGTWI